MTIKHMRVEYVKRSSTVGAFFPGDVLLGRVLIVTGKETSVQRLLVIAKGKVEVRWPEPQQEQQGGGPPALVSDKKRYFYFEKTLLQDKKGDGSVTVGPGQSSYSFSFDIPNRDMPSSYDGKWGSVTYTLHAKLTQSAWLRHKAKTQFPLLTKAEFPFCSRSEMIIIGLKEPQYSTRITFCGSGKVTVNVSTESMSLTQGESMEVKAEVLNDSAHAVTPRFYLCERQTFVTRSKRTMVHGGRTEFGAGGAVVPGSAVVLAGCVQTVARVLSAPPDLHPTFFNCSVMKLEYQIKVTLEFAQARNAEVKLPLIVLRGSATPPPQKAKKSRRFLSLPGQRTRNPCTD